MKPLVSILTPVYNGEQYLEECIQSVLKQTYSHWEYVIANNCSTDSTLDIARRYARQHPRIRVHSFDAFVGVVENHNRTFRLISPNSKYCKVVCADDWLFPECIAEMVELAELHPSLGIVGAYSLNGEKMPWKVKFDGLPQQTNIMSGADACRWHLLGGHHFLGCETSVLYRSDLIRSAEHFFPNSREHADISAFYECLRHTNFGFIHHALTCERVHGQALGVDAKQNSTYLGSQLLDVLKYGPQYLQAAEIEARVNALLDTYYKMLATGLVNMKGKAFWQYHRDILKQCGRPFYGMRFAKALLFKICDLILNPKQTIEKIIRRGRKSRSVEHAPASSVLPFA